MHFNEFVVDLGLKHNFKFFSLLISSNFRRHIEPKQVCLVASPAIDLSLGVVQGVLASKVHLEVVGALVDTGNSNKEHIASLVVISVDQQLIGPFPRTVPLGLFN